MKFFDLDHEETAAKERRRKNEYVVITDLKINQQAVTSFSLQIFNPDQNDQG
jgi:hypothetical protein